MKILELLKEVGEKESALPHTGFLDTQALLVMALSVMKLKKQQT